MTGDTRDVTEMATTATALPEATSTEEALGVGLDLSRLAMIDTTDRERTGDLDPMVVIEMMKDSEIDVIDQWSEDARQVRRNVPKARLQSHNLLKMSVIGGLFSYNSLLRVSEQRSSSNSSRRLDLSKKLKL